MPVAPHDTDGDGIADYPGTSSDIAFGGAAVSSSNPLPVQQAGVVSAPFHDVTQVTAGAASGTLFAANAKRYSILVLNTSQTETVWCDDGAATVGGGFPIYPRAAIRFTHQEAMNVIRGGSSNVTLALVEEYAT